MENAETKLKPGTAEYESDVIKRARKAAQNVGKTLENYRLMGEALSIMRHRAMKVAGLTGSNKAPAGPKYAKALNEELDKAPEFLDASVFEGGSARTHCVWLHEAAADVEWTFTYCERMKPGSTRKWNNPTYIWKQWRRLTKEPTKAALDKAAAKEAKAKAQAEELERYRNEWKFKYEKLREQVEEQGWTVVDERPIRELPNMKWPDSHDTTITPKPKPKRKRKAKEQEGGFAPGVLEAIKTDERGETYVSKKTGKTYLRHRSKGGAIVNDIRAQNGLPPIESA